MTRPMGAGCSIEIRVIGMNAFLIDRSLQTTTSGSRARLAKCEFGGRRAPPGNPRRSATSLWCQWVTDKTDKTLKRVLLGSR
jgi:hypothetical protein